MASTGPSHGLSPDSLASARRPDHALAFSVRRGPGHGDPRRTHSFYAGAPLRASVKRLPVEDLPASGPVRSALGQFLARLDPGTQADVERVIVFGSVARGGGRSTSDVDVLVVWRGSLHEALDRLLAVATQVWLETGVDLSVHPVPLAQFDEMARMRTGFYQNLDREGILVEG